MSVRKILVFVSLLYSLSLVPAQSYDTIQNPPTRPQKIFAIPPKNNGLHISLGTAYSTEIIATQPYQVVFFKPLYVFDKFSLLLDFQLPFKATLGATPTFDIPTELWTFENTEVSTRTYLSLLQLQYGYPSDNLYLRWGPLSGIQLGNGRVMDNFTNSPDFTQITPGLHAVIDGSSFSFPYMGIELVWADPLNLDNATLRFYLNPLQEVNTPLEFMEIGVLASIYRNTLSHTLSDTLAYNYPIYTFALDFFSPLMSNRAVKIEVMVDYVLQMGSQFTQSSHFISTGIRSQFVDELFIEVAMNYATQGIIKQLYDEDLFVLNNDIPETILMDNTFGWEVETGLSLLNNIFLVSALSSGSINLDASPLLIGAEVSFTLREVDPLYGVDFSFYYHILDAMKTDEIFEWTNTLLGGSVKIAVPFFTLESNIALRPAPLEPKGGRMVLQILGEIFLW